MVHEVGLSSYSTAHLCLSFSAHFSSDYTLWVCFIWLTESFVQPKSLHNVYFTRFGVKKVCFSIHHSNRKNNYSHYSSPNTYLYSFPQSGKLKDSKGSLCQYLFCRGWVQEKNTQRCWCNKEAVVQALGHRHSAQCLHYHFKKIFQITDLEIYYLQIKLFFIVLGIRVKK